MDKIQLAMGRFMLVAIILTFALVLIGGGWYLYSHGGERVHYHAFQVEPAAFKSVGDLLRNGFSSPLGMIQLGLVVLVLTQMIRVALTVLYFLRLRELFFSLISTFILAVLCYSLFWRF